MSASPASSFVDCDIHPVFPPWTRALIKLGYSAAQSSCSNASIKFTVGICVPRVEFAALLVALGAIKWRCTDLAPKEGLEYLRRLHKTWVSFRVGGSTKVGRLDTIPENDSGEVKILDCGGRGLPDFGEMTMEERLNFVPPVSAGRWHVLDAKDWASIKPVGREFNEQHGARRDQVRRVALEARLSQQAEELIGRGAADWLVSSKAEPIEIFGCKSRLESELQEDIPRGENSGEFKFCDLLRPAGVNVTCPRTVIKSGSRIVPGNPDCLRIIEGSRNLEEGLRNSLDNNRLVLLSRGEASYEAAAQIVKSAFYNRVNDFQLAGVHPPAYVKIMAFQHK